MYADAATIELTRPFLAEDASPDRSVPLMSVARPDPRLVVFAEKCSGFLDLPENWNSYRARRIDASLLRDGLNILTMMLSPGTRTPDVVPTARGGIQIEWHDAERDLEIEIRGLGQYRVFHRKGDEDEEFDVLDDLSRLLPLVHSFKG